MKKIYIPNSLHKSLYHTLFESHFSFGMTVWGGVSNSKIKPVFIAQKCKHCLRIIFGDKEKRSILRKAEAKIKDHDFSTRAH